MPSVPETLNQFYEDCFNQHGATAHGVGWHDDKSSRVHFDKMLGVIPPVERAEALSILDVGCGYGGLLEHARTLGLKLDYTGLDPVASSVEAGRARYQGVEFIQGDLLNFQSTQMFDYVVCNGVFTKKLDLSIPQFNNFFQEMVKKMFSLCKRGIAFNNMSTFVNFFAPDLFYKNPLETISFCAMEISPKFCIDHSYEYYDYTMYVYKS